MVCICGTRGGVYGVWKLEIEGTCNVNRLFSGLHLWKLGVIREDRMCGAKGVYWYELLPKHVGKDMPFMLPSSLLLPLWLEESTKISRRQQ